MQGSHKTLGTNLHLLFSIHAEKAAKIKIFLLSGRAHPQGGESSPPWRSHIFIPEDFLGFCQRGMLLSRHHPNSTQHPQDILNLASAWVQRWQQLENGTVKVTPTCPRVAAGKIHLESQGIHCIPPQALGNPQGFGSGGVGGGLGSFFWVSI